MFMTEFEKNFNTSYTENGAKGFSSSGKALVDINFAVSSLRNASEAEIIQYFEKALNEDVFHAMRWLFFARDVRGGLGERRLFRTIIADLAKYRPQYIKPIIGIIPEYGRFDDLWVLLNNENTRMDVIRLIETQLQKDYVNMENGQPISLIAKWLPSINASSRETKHYAKIICKETHTSERDYRKTLSAFRSYLRIVETKMSAKQWEDIDYSAVPSRANLIYNNAFLRNDTERRRNFLALLESDKVKINSSVLYPHDILHKYCESYKNYDIALEKMWESLPNLVEADGKTLVVADGSGSMTMHIGNTNITALEVANALAIYFSERLSGAFKNKYVTFSRNPQLVDFTGCRTLIDKWNLARRHWEVSDTNIEAVFDLVLTTAKKAHMKQEDLPNNILIISDMEFNACAVCNKDEKSPWYERGSSVTPTLFEEIKRKFKEEGYQLPNLIFWNVNSRTKTIPLAENELGVALVSGFSPNVCKMIMSGKMNPEEALMTAIMDVRYAPIEMALRQSNFS